MEQNNYPVKIYVDSMHIVDGPWTFTLPLDRYKLNRLLDELDWINEQMGIQEGYPIVSVTSNMRHLNRSLAGATNIAELNYLAQRINGLGSYGCEKYEALLEVQSNALSIKDCINLCASLDNFKFTENVHGDYFLGWVEAERLGLRLEDESDEVAQCMDFEKLGEMVRMRENGIHTMGGYIKDYKWVLNDDYDGISLPAYNYECDSMLTVKISDSEDATPGMRDSILYLPLPDNAILRAMNHLGGNGQDRLDCGNYCTAMLDCKLTDSIIRLLEKDNQLDIAELNTLSKELSKIPQEACQELERNIDKYLDEHAQASLPEIISIVKETQQTAQNAVMRNTILGFGYLAANYIERSTSYSEEVNKLEAIIDDIRSFWTIPVDEVARYRLMVENAESEYTVNQIPDAQHDNSMEM